jgi:hypothetical protein
MDDDDNSFVRDYFEHALFETFGIPREFIIGIIFRISQMEQEMSALPSKNSSSSTFRRSDYALQDDDNNDDNEDESTSLNQNKKNKDQDEDDDEGMSAVFILLDFIGLQKRNNILTLQ